MSLEAVVADDLYDLTERLCKSGVEISGGLLGGEFGYGGEYSNDVFEMHPFWWGECECGYQKREDEWLHANAHQQHCYQWDCFRAGVGYNPDPDAEWEAPPVGFLDPSYDEIVSTLCAKHNVDPNFGTAIHCTCGQGEAWIAWHAANPHPAECPSVRPNFRHKSGIEVRWYKYIGRSMELSEFDKRQWRGAIAECEASVAAAMDDLVPDKGDNE